METVGVHWKFQLGTSTNGPSETVHSSVVPSSNSVKTRNTALVGVSNLKLSFNSNRSPVSFTAGQIFNLSEDSYGNVPDDSS